VQIQLKGIEMNLRLNLSRYAVLGVALAAVTAGRADPPLQPLPIPLFSFDRESPKVLQGLASAADICAPGPVVVVPGDVLGAVSPQDDLDAFCFFRSPPASTSNFALLFSARRGSQGTAEPDTELARMGVPFNLRDQAQRGHAAGDLYVATVPFTKFGALVERDARSNNNVLVCNNYDEGGTDFAVEPPTSAQTVLSGPVPEDEVQASGASAATLRAAPAVYYSLSSDSPSLSLLPGMPSGANIYYRASIDPNNTVPITLYASFAALGLLPSDDIDALVVFDGGLPGVYDAGDLVLLSLRNGSPSLLTIPNHSPIAPAADVFQAQVGATAAVFSNAMTIGLGAPSDDIDGLDLRPLTCGSAQMCATLWGIRAHRGDINCDDTLSFADINPFVLALTNPTAYPNYYPHCPLANADINGDGNVNFGDINPFVTILVSGGGAHAASQ
jgi:hypothetical protein